MKSLVSKRSIVIAGHKTSVSLEDEFWSSLKEIAGQRGMTLTELVAAIDRDREHAFYRQLFDFLCLVSIAISIAKTERGRRWSPKYVRPSEHSSTPSARQGSKFKSLADAWVDLSGGGFWSEVEAPGRKRKWVPPLLTTST